MLLLRKPLPKVARAIISAYSGGLYVPNDANCFQDSAATTAGAKDAVVGYVRDLIGTNHLTQATAGYKPFLRKGAKNWLLNSAALATQSVTTRAVAYTLHFTGTGTVTLSGTSTAGPLVGTSASDRVSLTFTPTAGSLTLTVSGTVTNAMLETGSSVSTYVETVGSPASNGEGPWWLDFDGSDDRLVFTSIPIQMSDSSFVVVSARAEKTPGVVFRNGGATGQRCPQIVVDASTPRYGWIDDAVTSAYIVSATNVIGSTKVYAARKAGNTKTGRLDGVVQGTDVQVMGATTLTYAQIGADSAAGSNPWAGPVYGVALGVGAITDAELAIVERYIGSLGGIAL